jgi:hypothetical protein
MSRAVIRLGMRGVARNRDGSLAKTIQRGTCQRASSGWSEHALAGSIAWGAVAVPSSCARSRVFRGLLPGAFFGFMVANNASGASPHHAVMTREVTCDPADRRTL